MKSSVWISFDLGLQGDYEGLYSWLDLHEAIECGDSFAFIKYEFKKDLVIELKKDLEKNVSFTLKDRIYVVFPDPKKVKISIGRFIIGGRRKAAWHGYGLTKMLKDEFDG